MDSKTETVSDREIARFMNINLAFSFGMFWVVDEEGEMPDYGDGTVYSPSTNWNQLMAVVQKIYSMYDEFDFKSIKDENIFLDVLDNPVKYPISDTYRKTVECIKFINSQSPPHN